MDASTVIASQHAIRRGPVIGLLLQPPGSIAKSHPQTVLDRGDPNALLMESGEGYRLWGNGSIAPLTGGGHVAVIGKLRVSAANGSAENDVQTAAQQLARAYARDGTSLDNKLFGHFAFIIVDPVRGRVQAGVDRMGTFPLYFAELPEGLILASDLATITAHPSVGASIEPQGLYNYVYFHMVPAPRSAYRHVNRLQMASCVIHECGKTTVRRYWQPNFHRELQHGNQNTSERLRDLLKQAVANSLEGVEEGRTGAFLSGGLDSSSVVGMLTEVQGARSTDAFAIGFDAKGYDEMPYARLTALHFGARLHEYYVTPDDVVSALPVIAASYDEPFGNSSALPTYFCARKAKEAGIRVLLAGDGGDEIFAGNERYARQLLFEKIRALPKPLHTLLASISRILPERTDPGRKARSFLRQVNTPLPARLQHYNFLRQFPAGQLFEPEWLEGMAEQYPEQLQEGTYHLPSGTALDRMLYLDWQFTLADNDLRKVSQMCSLAGIDVRYPMLDEELVAFSCTLTDREKLRGGELRHFYKRALRGWLPDATLDKRKHGFGLPFGVWLRQHQPLTALTDDALHSLRRRGIFRQHFLERAQALHREGHAAYFGELLWILVMLELWLQAHPDTVINPKNH